jgi:hypothetical protein
LGGVENDLFFFALLLFGLLFSLLFGLFLSLFGGESFLFLESLLFIFAQFSFTFSSILTLLVLGGGSFDFLFGFLLSWLLGLVGILFHFMV